MTTTPPAPTAESLLAGRRRVAVVAPHPDDFDVVAITLRRLRGHGATIDLLVMTSGASGVDDADFPGLDRAAKAALRESEQRRSCAFFGLAPERVQFLRLADDDSGHLADSPANEARLDVHLQRIRPELVFLPHFNDPNLAHQRTFAMASRCTARIDANAALVLNRDPKTIAMRANLHVLFDEREATWKRELLRHHESQHRRNLRTRGSGLDDRILEVNAAAAGGVPGVYAEEFEVRTAAAGHAPGWLQPQGEGIVRWMAPSHTA